MVNIATKYLRLLKVLTDCETLYLQNARANQSTEYYEVISKLYNELPSRFPWLFAKPQNLQLKLSLWLPHQNQIATAQ